MKVPRCYECSAILPLHIAGCSATARVSILDIAHEFDEAGGSKPLPAWWSELANQPYKRDDETDDEYAARIDKALQEIDE